MPRFLELPRRYNAATHFIDRHIAEGRGAKTAFIDDKGSCTYAELAARVNRAGNLLKAQGVKPEQRVLLAMLDSIDFPAMFWGAMKIGAVPVPVNTLLTTPDYDFMLRDSRAVVLCVSDALMERFRPIISGQPYLEKVLISGKGTAHRHTAWQTAGGTVRPARGGRHHAGRCRLLALLLGIDRLAQGHHASAQRYRAYLRAVCRRRAGHPVKRCRFLGGETVLRLWDGQRHDLPAACRRHRRADG